MSIGKGIAIASIALGGSYAAVHAGAGIWLAVMIGVIFVAYAPER